MRLLRKRIYTIPSLLCNSKSLFLPSLPLCHQSFVVRLMSSCSQQGFFQDKVFSPKLLLIGNMSSESSLSYLCSSSLQWLCVNTLACVCSVELTALEMTSASASSWGAKNLLFLTAHLMNAGMSWMRELHGSFIHINASVCIFFQFSHELLIVQVNDFQNDSYLIL